MSPDTEVAVISCAATPEQRTCTADLAHIGETVREAGLVSPAVIAVGKVVSLRDRLNFYENRPLFGKRFLIPKIGEKSTELKALLLQQGAAADEIQVGRIVRAERTFSAGEMKQADWLVFTSKNGVEAFFESIAKSRLDIRCLAGCRIAAIGGRTAKMLEGHGLYADLIPEEFHSDALADALKKQISPQDRVWYLKAGNADGHLKAALEGCCRFEEIEVYENQAVKPDLETLRKPEEYDGILFTCASSARRLLGAAGNEWKQCRAFSIGPKTTACLKECGMECTIEAEVSTYEGLVETLKQKHRR